MNSHMIMFPDEMLYLFTSFSAAVGKTRLRFVTTNIPLSLKNELMYFSFGVQTIVSNRLAGPKPVTVGYDGYVDYNADW